MKKIMLSLTFILISTLLYAGDFGYQVIQPTKYSIQSKSSGNTFGLNFDACIFIKVTENNETYYYYVKEGSLGFKSLVTLLFNKFSNDNAFTIGWSGTTDTSNGKKFRRIVLIK